MSERISTPPEGDPRQEPEGGSPQENQLSGSNLGAPAPEAKGLKELSERVREWQQEREGRERARRDDYKPQPPSGIPPFSHR